MEEEPIWNSGSSSSQQHKAKAKRPQTALSFRLEREFWPLSAVCFSAMPDKQAKRPTDGLTRAEAEAHTRQA